MLKMIGCIFLISAGYLGGYHFSYDCKLRLEQLYELKRIISLLEGEIRYKKTTLPEAFLGMSHKTKSPFLEFLIAVGKEMQENRELGITEIWREKSKELVKQSALKGGDLEALQALGNSLGYLDVKTQVDNLSLCKEQTDVIIRRLQGEIAQKGRLYQCLGIAGGVLLVIIFI